MRRDSTKARELVALLASHGVEGVSGRNLEDYSRAGLLPPEGTAPGALVAHLRELRRVYRRGPDAATRATLVLAARGYGCAGLRDALIRAYRATSQDDLTAQVRLAHAEPGPDPDTDEGSWAVENEARAMVEAASQGTGPPAVAAFMAGMMSAAQANAQASPIVDPVTTAAESPETTIVSALSQVLAFGYGGEVTEPEAIARLSSPDPLGGAPCEEDLAIAEALRGAEALGDAVLANLGAVPIPLLVEGAKAARSLLAIPAGSAMGAPILKAHEQLDLLAGMMAPLGMAIISAFSTAAPDLLVELGPDEDRGALPAAPGSTESHQSDAPGR